MISHEQAQSVAAALYDVGFLKAYWEGRLSGIPVAVEQLETADKAMAEAEALIRGHIREHYPRIADIYGL